MIQPQNHLNPPSKPSLLKMGPVSLSLFAHTVLMLIVGSVVVVEHVIPKGAFQPTLIGENFDQAVPTEELPDDAVEEPSAGEPLELPTEMIAAPESTTFDSSIDAIAVDSPSSPSPWQINSGSSTGSVVSSGLSSGGGGGSGTAGGAKTKIGNIFGTKVEANKLGVILDISGSAHPHLVAALKEIDKSFQDSPTVLAMGCGMGDITGQGVEVLVYGEIKPDKEKDKPKSRTSLGQLADAMNTQKGLGRHLDRLKKRSDVWAIQGGDVYATHLAFEKLIAEGCDTIYWFADFADKLNPSQMERLITELKGKSIKVIAHKFIDESKPVPNLPARMAKETGGESISKIP
jgi:hypothetical protein